jgi:L-2,4-diaminobutyrate transaminase
MLEKSREIGPFGHGYTYSAHPVAAAAAMVNLDIFEREDLVGNATRVGAYMQRRVREAFADHPLVGHVRGVGLILALELVADKRTKASFPPAIKAAAAVAKHAYADGLVVRPLPGGDIIALSPPLSITEAEVDQIVAGLIRAIESATAELRLAA